MIGIVVSEADPASIAIGEALRSAGTWETRQDDARPAADGGGTVHDDGTFSLRTFEELHLHLTDVADAFDDPSAIVFVSKHAGDTGPLLTAHVPGNVGNAAHGGSPRSLPPAAPGLMHAVFDGMQREAPPAFDVGIECTHHGPSRVGAPTLFAEVGSGPEEWADPDAAAAVARAVLGAPDADPGDDRTVVGFGGGHYAPRFTRILRETGWHVGHLAADWSLDELRDAEERRRIVDLAIERSRGDVALVAGERPALRETLAAADVPVVGERWLRESDSVPLALVDRIETMLGPIDEGTRIGDRLPPTAAELRRIDLPDDLVAPVNGHDHAEAIGEIGTVVAGFHTRENGNRLTGGLAVAPDVTIRDVVESLEPILESRFTSVNIDVDAVVLEEERFDPAQARKLGVPEGPAFGRLSNGEAVTVDGRTVEPDAVITRHTRRIPLEDR